MKKTLLWMPNFCIIAIPVSEFYPAGRFLVSTERQGGGHAAVISRIFDIGGSDPWPKSGSASTTTIYGR
jgi:hypothetical protein